MTIGGVPTARATRAQLAACMAYDYRRVKRGKQLLPRVVVSSNGAVVAAFHQDAAFRESILQADIIDADGMPLVMASRLLTKTPLLERTSTTDFIHDAAAVAAASGIRFYFLGAKEGVVQTAAAKLVERHPGLQIAGVRNGYFKREEEEAICADIRASGADVLWLGLGSPNQEAFALRNRHLLQGLTWIRTCGGLFDHVAGRFHRAPLWVQKAGMEWLFRAAQEPARLGPRYLATNPVALYHLLTKTGDR